MEKTRIPTDDPSPAATGYVGAVFAVIFVLTVIALVAYFNRVRSEEFEVKVVEQPSAAVRDLRAEQLGQIREYRWIDREAGTVAIPIERAMALVVEERARQDREGSGS